MNNQSPNAGNDGTAEFATLEQIPAAALRDFAVADELDQGVHATVYRATYTPTGVAVALKVAKGDGSKVAKEAAILATLHHPHIVPVAFRSEPGEQVFLAEPVLKKITDMPVHDRMRLLAEIAEGLDYAHDQGVLHRDIKPSSFMVGDEESGMLIDFSEACRDDEPQRSRFTGGLVYMAPEVADLQPHTRRSDLYSFAIACHEVMYGMLPNPAKTIPPAVQRAMAADPAARYEAAVDFLYDFAKDIAQAEPV